MVKVVNLQKRQDFVIPESLNSRHISVLFYQREVGIPINQDGHSGAGHITRNVSLRYALPSPNQEAGKDKSIPESVACPPLFPLVLLNNDLQANARRKKPSTNLKLEFLLSDNIYVHSSY